ncbi:glutamyl-tRNA synthetase [Buchnera aphidicola str. Ak (Acyrthosiphon kondoi)]|uniref:Glutamate--tRNA ligase n=1 Tax=Buchnera aphidicola str. Ak (Acyrthosiphon kondoi) TaxID=1005090 RepID=G2LME8_9GAMM|nr:glutamate--tRNA ligase [Buchnera aphidicola]AEO08436.1 glutamyl-tRNA synthetase [Buchnera aphidicola str. Ak (Acyrthosiphon kondoi)]
MKVRTRFAPSPTGNLHIGSIRTALYSWLFARHHNGKFILRIEDTDLSRSESISINSIVNGLKWLGLDWDEGPYFQTQRLHRYKEVINIMLEKGDAYICVCSCEKLEEVRLKQIEKGYKPRYPGTCRNLKIINMLNQNYVIRFKNPLSGKVVFQDKIRGEISFDNSELDDLIIQRSNGMPTYNFCVVVDDLDMKITHVIRGEDHINNTPRQINILKSLDFKIPIYAHLSMILDEEGHKISKRKNAINILEYCKNGFLPEALLNYIIRLGWSCGDKEIFNISEMKELFNLKSIGKSSSTVNIKKLLWMNKYYINNLPLNYIANLLKNYMKKQNINIKNGPDLESLVKLFRSRYHTLKEITESCRYFYEEFNFFNKTAVEQYFTIQNCCILEECYERMKKLFIWDNFNISIIINDISQHIKITKKEINMILRVSITGNIHSPSISSVIDLIGKDKTLLRIKKAINYIKNL